MRIHNLKITIFVNNHSTDHANDRSVSTWFEGCNTLSSIKVYRSMHISSFQGKLGSRAVNYINNIINIKYIYPNFSQGDTNTCETINIQKIWIGLLKKHLDSFLYRFTKYIGLIIMSYKQVMVRYIELKEND